MCFSISSLTQLRFVGTEYCLCCRTVLIGTNRKLRRGHSVFSSQCKMQEEMLDAFS